MIIVAEIGINHNGNLRIAKQMIGIAKAAGCDYVKFQKRTVDKVYSKEELDRPRESPWGDTNRDQKLGLEFGIKEYANINYFCIDNKIKWFASPWDCDSVKFLSVFNIPYIKIASACITDMRLLEHVRASELPVIISTGMSTKTEVDNAVNYLGEQLEYILACTSTYPTPPNEVNLRFIETLKKDYPNYKIGFSNHSPGLTFCVAAAALGAEMIEFHLTRDRSMYGSDQAASIEAPGVFALVKHLRNIGPAMGTGEWTIYDSEKKIRDKLRKIT